MSIHNIQTTVMYLSTPLMIMIGFAPTLWLAVAAEYTRSLHAHPDRACIRCLCHGASIRPLPRYLKRLFSVTWSIGFSVGPTAAGWLQTNVNISTSFVFGAICLSLSASLLLLFFGKIRIPYSP